MIKNPSNAEHYHWGEGCDGWRLVSRADLSVIEERIPPGRAEVRHYHARARQCFFVLSGQLEIEVGTEVARLTPGDALEVAPGEAHCVYNRSELEAIFLVISAPTTQGDRVNLT